MWPHLVLPPSGWQHSICPLGHLGYTFRPVCIVGIGPLTVWLCHWPFFVTICPFDALFMEDLAKLNVVAMANVGCISFFLTSYRASFKIQSIFLAGILSTIQRHLKFLILCHLVVTVGFPVVKVCFRKAILFYSDFILVVFNWQTITKMPRGGIPDR